MPTQFRLRKTVGLPNFSAVRIGLVAGFCLLSPVRADLSAIETYQQFKADSVSTGAGIDKRIDELAPLLTPAPQVTLSEVDRQLLLVAFNHLKKSPQKAAEVARKRLNEEPPLPDRSRAQLLWIAGSGLSLTNRHVEAMQSLEEAEKLARTIDDPKLLRRVLRYIAASAFETGQYRRGSRAATEGLEISGRLDDKTTYVCLLYNERAGCESKLGNFESAIANYHSALKIAIEHDDAKLQSMLLANLGSLHDQLGQHAAAIIVHRQSIELAQSKQLPLVVAAATANLGDSQLKTGDLVGAKQTLQEALALTAVPSTKHLRGGVECSLGDLALKLNDAAQAQQHFKNAETIWKELGDASGVMAVQQRLVVLRQTPDNSQESIAELEKQLAEANRIEDNELQLSSLQLLTAALVEAKNWEQATGRLKELVELERKQSEIGKSSELSNLRSKLVLVQKQHQIGELEREKLLRQLTVTNQRQAIAGLIAGLVVVLGLLAVVAYQLRKKWAAIRELTAAQGELENRKKVQIDLERRHHEHDKSESLSLLAAGIAHDFNNLLMGIVGFTEIGLLARNDEGKNSSLRQISATSFQAAELTGQLMQFLGQRVGRESYTDLTTCIESIRGLLTSVARPRATIEFVGGDQTLVADVDEVGFRKAIVNLVSNAADATLDSGLIELTVGRKQLSVAELAAMKCGNEAVEGDFGFVTIHDFGYGMSSETKQRIFDPYFSTKGTGRGLGMASVLGIVRASRGAIDVQSTPGKGSCISLYLPLVDKSPANETVDAETVRPATQEAPVAAAAHVNPLILIVDDDITVLESYAALLTCSGFRVIKANSSSDALILAKQRVAELTCVVSDYAMPLGNGTTLAKQLQQLAPNLPVIICSGFALENVDSNPDVFRFLQKPFPLRQLIDTVNECVALSRDLSR